MNLQGLLHFTLCVSEFLGLTLIIEILALSKSHFHLCHAILQVHTCRDKTVSLQLYLLIHLGYFILMQQKLSVSCFINIEDIAVFIVALKVSFLLLIDSLVN